MTRRGLALGLLWTGGVFAVGFAAGRSTKDDSRAAHVSEPTGRSRFSRHFVDTAPVDWARPSPAAPAEADERAVSPPQESPVAPGVVGPPAGLVASTFPDGGVPAPVDAAQAGAVTPTAAVTEPPPTSVAPPMSVAPSMSVEPPLMSAASPPDAGAPAGPAPPPEVARSSWDDDDRQPFEPLTRSYWDDADRQPSEPITRSTWDDDDRQNHHPTGP